jgi:hypothetical protein
MFKLTSYINIIVFIISLSLGLFLVYIGNGGEHKTIYVYPTPENVHLLQYKDPAGTCFRYKPTVVSCPANAKDITKIPIQT